MLKRSRSDRWLPLTTALVLLGSLVAGPMPMARAESPPPGISMPAYARTGQIFSVLANEPAADTDGLGGPGSDLLSVAVSSTSDPVGFPIVMQETEYPGVFSGAFELGAETDAPSYLLQVADGDTVTVSYALGTGESDIATATVDDTAPYAAGVAPADGAMGVPVGLGEMTVQFIEPVEMIANPGISMTDELGSSVSLTPALGAEGMLLTLTPGATLNLQSTYTVTIPAGTFTDLAGNASTEITWSFTTVSVVLDRELYGGNDVVAVSVFDAGAPDGAVGIVVEETNFDRSLYVSLTGSGGVFTGSFATVDSGAGDGATSIGVAGMDWLRVGYDQDGNHLLDLLTEPKVDVPVDAAPPYIASSNPEHTASGVGLAGVITVTFSEEVVAGSLYAGIVLATGSETGPVVVPGTVTDLAGNTLTLSYTGLEYGTTYGVDIPADAVRDQAGNPFVPLVIPALAFATEAAPDTAPPAVVTLSPGDGATEVALDASIVVLYDEPIQSGTAMAEIALTPQGGDPVYGNGRISGTEGDTLEIDHTPLLPGTLYTVSVPEGAVADLSGNLGAALTWSFTTGVVADPVVAITEPAAGAWLPAAPTITGTVTDADLAAVELALVDVLQGLYWDGSGWTDLQTWLSVTPTGSAPDWSFSYSAPDRGDGEYQVMVRAEDQYGGTGQATATYHVDTLPPAYTGLGPAGPNTPEVMLVFSEPIYTTGDLLDTTDLVATVEGLPRAVSAVAAIAAENATEMVAVTLSGEAPLAGATVAMAMTPVGAAKVQDLAGNVLSTAILSQSYVAGAGGSGMVLEPAAVELHSPLPAEIVAAGLGACTNLTVTLEDSLGNPVTGAVDPLTVEVWTDSGTGATYAAFAVDAGVIPAAGDYVVMFACDGDETAGAPLAVVDDPPALAVAEVEGSALELIYDQLLDESAVPPATHFTVVETAPDQSSRAVLVTGISVAGDTVYLTLESAVLPDSTVTISYSLDQNPAPLQDSGGQQAAALTEMPVDNYTGGGGSGLPGYYPLCSVNNTVSCVESVTRLSGTVPSAEPVPQVFAAGGLVQVQLWTPEGSDDLTGIGADGSSRFAIALQLRGYTPRLLLGAGREVAWSVNQLADYTQVVIEVQPVPVHSISTLTDLAYWPVGAADAADMYRGAVVALAIDELAEMAEMGQGLELTGTILATDAQMFGAPVYAAPDYGQAPELRLFIGGPHLQADGVTTHIGFFEAHLSPTLVSTWGVSDPADLSAIYLDQGTATAQWEGDGIRLDLDVHYSSGDVTITSATAGGQPGGVTFTDGDLDHVYFNGDPLAASIPLDPAYNGMSLQLALGIFGETGTFLSQPVLAGATDAGSYYYLPATVANGAVLLSGTVSDPSGTLPPGVVAVQVYSPMGQAMGEPMPLTDGAGEMALVGICIPAGEISATPDLSELDNLYDTEQSITFTREGLGSITFAPGLNLVDSRDELMDLQAAIQFGYDSVATTLTAGVDTNTLTFLAAHGATIQLFDARSKLGLTQVPAQNFLSQIDLEVLDNSGTPVTDIGSHIDLAALAYDEVNDILTIPVYHFSTVAVQPAEVVVTFDDADPDGVYYYRPLDVSDTLAFTLTGVEPGLSLTATFGALDQSGSFVATGAVATDPVTGTDNGDGSYSFSAVVATAADNGLMPLAVQVAGLPGTPAFLLSQDLGGGEYRLALVNINPQLDPALGLDGATTDFSTVANLTQVTGLTFERSSVGRMTFTGPIDVLAEYEQLLQLGAALDLAVTGAAGLDTGLLSMLAGQPAAVTLYDLPLAAPAPGWVPPIYGTGGDGQPIPEAELATILSGAVYDPETGSLNFAAAHFSTYWVDTEAPAVPTGVTAAWLDTETAQVTWDAAPDNVGVDHYLVSVWWEHDPVWSEAGVTDSTSFTGSNFAAGSTYRFRVAAVDASSSVSDWSAVAEVTLPPASPMVSVAAGSYGVGDEVLVSALAQEGLSAAFTIPGVSAATGLAMAEDPQDPGTYTGSYTVQSGDSATEVQVSVILTDDLGQSSEPGLSSYSITLDGVAPGISGATHDAQGALPAGAEVTITVVASTDTATVSYTFVTGRGPQEGNLSPAGEPGTFSGSYTVVSGDDTATPALMVVAVDALGNESAPQPVSGAAFTIDTIPPAAPVVETTAGFYKAGDVLRVTVTGEAGSSGEWGMGRELGPLPLTETAPGLYTGSYTVQPGEDYGTNPLVAALTDGAGNVSDLGYSAAEVTIDAVPPEALDLSLSLFRGEAPLPFNTILRAGDTVELVVATAEAGLSATWSLGELVSDGTMTEANPEPEFYTYTGRYTVQAGDDGTEVPVAFTLADAAGNRTEPESVAAVTIDTVAETFSASHNGAQVAAAAGRTLLRAGDTLTITLTAESGGTGSYTFSTAGGQRSGTMVETASSRYTATYTVQAMDDYLGTIAVDFTDAAANVAPTRYTGSLGIDTTAPAVLDVLLAENGELSPEPGEVALKAGDILQVSITSEPGLSRAELVLGEWTLPLDEVAAGEYSTTLTVEQGQDMSGGLTAHLVDAAGNVSEGLDLGYTVRIDTLPPVVWVEVNGGLNTVTGYYTRFDALYLQAMAEAGLRVVLEEQDVDGNWADLSASLTLTTADLGDGQYRHTYEYQPADGDRTFRYWAEDAAGNRSHAPGAEPVFSYRIDTTLPDTPRNLGLAEAVNGFVDGSTGTVTGDLPSADVVWAEVRRDHEVIAQGSVQAGATTFAVAGVPLREGENTLSVRVSDAAGNTTGSDYLTVIRDTGAPSFEVTLVQGSPNQVTVEASEPLAAPPTVTVKLNGGVQPLGGLTQTGPTTYQTTFAAAIGSQTVLVVVNGQDPAGHTGAGEYIEVVNLDPALPWSVELDTLQMNIPSGSLQSGNMTLAPMLSLEVAGLLDEEQGEAVERPTRFGLTLNEGSSITVTFLIRPGLNPSQVRSIRYFPAGGDPAQVEDVTDFAYDPATGRVTATLSHFSDYGVIVDQTAPDFAFGLLSSPVGNRLLMVTGSHDGSAETVSLTGDIVTGPVAAAVDPAGTWSAEVELTTGDGTKRLTATAADAAGNAASLQTSVTLDTTPPVLNLTVANPQYVPGEVLYTSASSLGLAGTVTDASPITTYVVQDDVTKLGTATNSFNLTLTLPANQLSIIQVMTQDATCPLVSRELRVRRDTLAPAISATLDTTLTSGDTVQFSGSVADGSGGGAETLQGLTLKVRRDGTLVATQDLGQSAAFAGSVALTEDGTYTLTFTATDKAGNTGSLQRTVIRDSDVPPVTLAVSDDKLKSGDGDEVMVTVTTAVGNPVTVKLNGGIVATGSAGAAGASGRFSTTVNLTADGRYTLRAEVTGSNALTAAAERTLLRDTELPALTADAVAASTSSSSGSIAASATEPVTFTVRRGDDVVATSSAGVTDATLTVPLVVGQNDLTVTATDLVGNSQSSAVSITRTSPPAGGGGGGGGGGLTAYITAAAQTVITNQSSVRISGHTLAEATVTVRRDGQTLATLQAGKSGSFAYTAALEEGENNFTLTAETAAGSASTSLTVTRDSQPPALTVTVEQPDVAAGTATLVIQTEPWATVFLGSRQVATASAAGEVRVMVSLQVGANHLSLELRDLAGNTTVEMVTVQRAFAAPAEASLDGGRGGRVTTPDGVVQLDVPPGAAVGQLTLQLVPAEPRQPDDGFTVVAAAEVTARRQETADPVARFAQPLRLTFRFGPETAAGLAGLGIYYWNEEIRTWVMLPTEVDAARGTATATTDHLSRFALMADTSGLRPVLGGLPTETDTPELQVSGQTLPGARVWLTRNDAFTGSTTADGEGRFALTLNLVEGENRILALAESGGLRRAGVESRVTYSAPTAKPEGPLAGGVGRPSAGGESGSVQPLTPGASAPVASGAPAAPPPAVRLRDLTGHWAEEEIVALVQAGVVSGFADQTFGPDRPVTRAQFSVMLARALGLADPGEASRLTFADAWAIPDWAAGAVSALQEAGLIAGYEDNTFRPEALITRAEMAVLMDRALVQMGMTPGQPVPPAQPGRRFSDEAGVPDWAREAVTRAVAAGLVGGFPDGSFRPDATATRAQAAVMIRRLMAAR